MLITLINHNNDKNQKQYSPDLKADTFFFLQHKADSPDTFKNQKKDQTFSQI